MHYLSTLLHLHIQPDVFSPITWSTRGSVAYRLVDCVRVFSHHICKGTLCPHKRIIEPNHTSVTYKQPAVSLQQINAQAAEAVLNQFNNSGYPWFRLHPKGRGVIVARPEGVAPFTFVQEYLGEVHTGKQQGRPAVGPQVASADLLVEAAHGCASLGVMLFTLSTRFTSTSASHTQHELRTSNRFDCAVVT